MNTFKPENDTAELGKESPVVEGKMYPEEKDIFMGYEDLEAAIKDSKYTSQAEVLARMLSRENVFVSGPPGSGKSAVAEKYIEIMGNYFGENVHISITGTTGFVASSIGGKTIHSWSGIGIGTDVKRIPALARETDVLIIDEISMLPAYYLDLVDQVCRRAKGKMKVPFGGIQIIILGDFMQLPPVPNRDIPKELDQSFAFFSESWKEGDIKLCYLDKIHRSKDARLTRVLSDIEKGTITQETVDIIKRRKKEYVSEEDSKVYTKLYTVNKKVDEINAEELDKNPNDLKAYNRSIVRVGGSLEEQEEYIKLVSQPPRVELKEGAKVMVTKNGDYMVVSPKTYTVLGETFVPNGSVGRVLKIMERKDTSNYFIAKSVLVKLNSGETVAISTTSDTRSKSKTIGMSQEGKPITKSIDIIQINYMPLKLAYAITVHKSQGQTLDGVITDLSKCFSPGMGYVALSRVRSLDDLIVEKIDKKAFIVNEDSRKIAKDLKNGSIENRKQFLEDIETYQSILEIPFTRYVYWEDKLK